MLSEVDSQLRRLGYKRLTPSLPPGSGTIEYERHRNSPLMLGAEFHAVVFYQDGAASTIVTNDQELQKFFPQVPIRLEA
jgi:hypothetical protein